MTEPTAAGVIDQLQNLLVALKSQTSTASTYLDGVAHGMASSENLGGLVAALSVRTQTLTEIVQTQTEFLNVTLGLLRLLAVRSEDLRDREADLTQLIDRVVDAQGQVGIGGQQLD